MKYIRTFFGTIIEPKSYNPNNDYYQDKHLLEGCYTDEIVNSANTIEELMDCYVVMFEYQDRPLIVYKSEIEYYKYCFVNKVKSNNRVVAIYGSIWVGSDLLSKSKMNDKGELELL